MRSLFHFRRVRWRTWTVAVLLIAMTFIAFAYKPARPPKPELLASVWIGFDNDELNFTRLDLRPDFTGYCARVSPADTSLHEYGVDGYRVTKWGLDKWKFSVTLTPATTNAEPIYLRGRYSGFSLRLEVGGTNGQWKRDVILYRESRMDGANQETRGKIGELEKP
jgi:hypothetical protein